MRLGLGAALHTSLFSVQRNCLWASQLSALHFSHPLQTREERTLRRFRSSHKSQQKKSLEDQTGPLRRTQDSRVSSELRKLSLEDFPEEREKLLRQNPERNVKAENHEVVFGVTPCLLALTQCRRNIRKLYVKEGESSSRASVVKVCQEAHRREVPVQHVRKKDLDTMACGGVHQGVCLQASSLHYITEEPETSRTQSTTPLWLVLEKIQDPMNLGAILRTAYFLGVDRVVSSLRHSCPLSPVVSKASSGAMEAMKVFGSQNLSAMLKMKVAQGWDVVGTVSVNTKHHVPVTPCSTFTLRKPTLLLIGGEAAGLSPELLSQCHTLLTIPPGRDLVQGIESLNVSVAVGILLHSLLLAKSSGS